MPKRSHLLIAGLLAAVGLVLAWVASNARESALREMVARGNDRLQWHRLILQRELERFEILPKMLAQNSELIAILRGDGDRWGVDRYLERLTTMTGASDIYVMDRTGMTISASNWNGPRTFIGERLDYRPYFKDAMRGRAGRYFALGTTSGRRGFYFSYPIVQHQTVVGVVAVKVDAEGLEQVLARDDDAVLVSDAEGVIFLSTRPQWLYRSLKPLTQEIEAAKRASRQYDTAELTPLGVIGEQTRTDGARLLTIDAASDQPAAPAAHAVTYLAASSPVSNSLWELHLLSDVRAADSSAVRDVMFTGVMFVVLLSLAGFLYQRRVTLLNQLDYQRHAHEALQQSDANTRLIIANTPAGLVTTDRGGRIRFMNPVAGVLFGCKPDEVVDRPFHELLAPAAQADFGDWLSARLAEKRAGIGSIVDTTASRPDGSEFPVEISISQMQLSGDSQLLMTVLDLSERKRTEEALQRAHDELEARVRSRTIDLSLANERLLGEINERKRAERVLRQAQDELIQSGKLAAIGQMATAVTHEINQPLAAIRCYADNARELLRRERTQEVRKNLDSIFILTDHMAKISGELKGFARKSTGTPVPVSLTEVVDRALVVVGAHTRLDRCRLHRQFPDEHVRVLCDPLRLEQVLLNLLKNAVDAMANAARREIHIAVSHDGGHGVLRLRDTGPGIPQDQLASVFDPFFTTKERGHGLGLGLSISRGIVHDYGGTIRAGNHPDGGCEFVIELPLATAQAVKSAVQLRSRTS